MLSDILIRGNVFDFNKNESKNKISQLLKFLELDKLWWVCLKNWGVEFLNNMVENDEFYQQLDQLFPILFLPFIQFL